MATLPHQRAGAAEAHPQTYDVTLHLAINDHVSEERVVDLAVQMNEAIDRHTGEEVAGVDVSGAFNPPAIEIGLDVVATSMADVHVAIGNIMSVIERECALTLISNDLHIERMDNAPALACV